jgi:hypothetical protein
MRYIYGGFSVARSIRPLISMIKILQLGHESMYFAEDRMHHENYSPAWIGFHPSNYSPACMQVRVLNAITWISWKIPIKGLYHHEQYPSQWFVQLSQSGEKTGLDSLAHEKYIQHKSFHRRLMRETLSEQPDWYWWSVRHRQGIYKRIILHI